MLARSVMIHRIIVCIAAVLLTGIQCCVADDQANAAPQKRLSAKEWLQHALDVSLALKAKAVSCDPEILKDAALRPAMGQVYDYPVGPIPSGKVFLSYAQIEDYNVARPWAYYYGDFQDSFFQPPQGGLSIANGAKNPNKEPVQIPRVIGDKPTFPSAEDAPELRALLLDNNPAIRSLAVEALALLEQPEDVARIAAMMNDTATGAPYLGWNMPYNMVFRSELYPGMPAIRRSWRSISVGDYAKRSVYYMTGIKDINTFPDWWKTHSDGKKCLWYWQKRAEHIIVSPSAWPTQIRGKNYLETEEQKRVFVKDQLEDMFKELSHESPEVEAKVKLLVVNKRNSPDDFALESPLKLRIEPERLLELLERKNLWPDVDWADGDDWYYIMSKRILLHAQGLKRKDVPRLRAVYEKSKMEDSSFKREDSSFIIAISRLLPPAKTSNLDDPDTRDGTLRNAIKIWTNPFNRGDVARELVATALPANCEFLKEQFFAEKNTMNAAPDMRTSIIIALGEPPLTREKRSALIDLLLDERFRAFWTQGDTWQLRDSAVQAVNAHSNSEIITENESHALTNPEKSEATLADVLKKVRGLK